MQRGEPRGRTRSAFSRVDFCAATPADYVHASLGPYSPLHQYCSCWKSVAVDFCLHGSTSFVTFVLIHASHTNYFVLHGNGDRDNIPATLVALDAEGSVTKIPIVGLDAAINAITVGTDGLLALMITPDPKAQGNYTLNVGHLDISTGKMTPLLQSSSQNLVSGASMEALYTI